MSDPVSARDAVTAVLVEKLIPKSFQEKHADSPYVVLMMDGLRQVVEDVFRIVDGKAEDDFEEAEMASRHLDELHSERTVLRDAFKALNDVSKDLCETTLSVQEFGKRRSDIEYALNVSLAKLDFEEIR